MKGITGTSASEQVERMACEQLLGLLAARTRAYDFSVWFWGDAIAVDGLLEAGELLDDRSSVEHVERFLRGWMATPSSWVDHLAPGRALLRLYERSGEEGYVEAAIRLAHWLRAAPHTADGVPMYRPDLPPYRHVAWVDTLYHEPPFFAQLAAITGDDAWATTALELWRAHTAALVHDRSPILGHSYDTGARLLRGHGWARGNGWAVLGAIDTLELLPADWRRDELLEAARSLCAVILELQDLTGFWHTLIEDREAYLEASTASFFGAAFEKGLRLGVLDEAFRPAADRAWDAQLSRVDDDGSYWGVSACTYASVHPDDDIQMYKTLPTEVNVWGQGAAMRFAAERLRSLTEATR